MLNRDFYPTPSNLIEKMVSKVDLRKVKTILEPSAGKGDIVDFIKNYKDSYGRSFERIEIDCVEIEPELNATLKGKGHHVVWDDFLTYNTYQEYDLILANFPFSNGCKHMLKALEMQERNGGEIVALLNAETLKNPYTNERKVLVQKLSELDADITYTPNAFEDAERHTFVETALIYVKLPERKEESFIWENLTKKEVYRELKEDEKGYLAENDFMKSIVAQYNMEIEAGVKLIREYNAMKEHILSSFQKDEDGKTVQAGGCIISMKISDGYGSEDLTINGFIKEVRMKYWKALFTNDKFTGGLTTNLREEYYSKVNELAKYDFSLKNIYEVKMEIMSKMCGNIEDTILELFEELGARYSYYGECSKNIHYYNGWCTNKAYMINKKVILPLNGFNRYYKDSVSPDWHTTQKLSDIEKVLSYLDNGRTDGGDFETIMRQAINLNKSRDIPCKYFNITFYKKGTCHITFKSEELLKKLNIYGSQKKGWLPFEYGKKKYKDMTKEEQAVINEFDGGEVEYSKIVNESEYYLCNVDSLLLEMAM